MRGSFFTAKQEAYIEDRWLRGDSGGAIARAIGRSRSATMGKIHRMGLMKARDPDAAKTQRQATMIRRWREPAYAAARVAAITTGRREAIVRRRARRLREKLAQFGPVAVGPDE